MIVLGISDSSVCGGAAVAIDGRVVAAVHEERLDRHKLSTGFPRRAIGEVLELAGLTAADLDRVQVADLHNYFKPESTYWRGWLVDHASRQKAWVAHASSALSSLVGGSDRARAAYYALKRRLTAARPGRLEALLRRDFAIAAPIRHVDHHDCHAFAAQATSGFPDCAVITLDGGGDFLCSRVYRAGDGRMERLHELASYHSIGNFYAYVTRICGFTAHKHEGKVTGLAAYGEPRYADLLRRMIRYEEPGEMRNRANAYYWSAVRRIERALPDGFRREDLAASIQTVLEDEVVRYCRYWIARSGSRNVALAGGVFANVRLNQKLHEIDAVDRLFVHPGMGDEGLAFGAAIVPDAIGLAARSAPLDSVYLGRAYDEAAMERALGQRGIAYRRSASIEIEIADRLTQGRVVGRFDGRMEYGPRALGNRSILYRPDDPSANDWLNARLDRSEFMPFAPAVREERAHECFAGLDGAIDSARFMTLTFDCLPQMRERCPGVVHVDGTARPQIVRPQDNPSLHAVLVEYERRSGLPAIVNTSFNVHDEPIVCSPDDAVRSFLDGRLDCLALGPFLAEAPRTEN